MSVKVDSITLNGTQLEIDISIKPTQPLESYQMTFSKEHIEALGIDWEDFVKSTNQIIEEIKIQSESEEARQRENG